MPDPTGTVLLSMRNDDGTSLDGLYIGNDDNFHGNGWKIASMGKVRGLGNVASIPTSGWADRVAVVPGNGYVAHNYWSDEFVRIWVSDYISGATTGGVIGAEVKYQKPFRGLDEAISLKRIRLFSRPRAGRRSWCLTTVRLFLSRSPRRPAGAGLRRDRHAMRVSFTMR